jgi:hypothetical protein
MSVHSANTTPATLRISWCSHVRALLSVQPAPVGWWRAAFHIYLANFLIIAVCIVGGHFISGNETRWFREARLGTFASVAALAMSGVICFQIQRRLRDFSLASFWSALSLLFCIVAADDLLSLHERIDRYVHYLLRRDRYDRVTDHLDNLIVATYTLPAFYMAARHGRLLIEARLTLHVLAVAFVFFAVHLVLDALTIWPLMEEILKLTAGSTILVALLATLMQPALPASWTHGGAAEASPALRDVRRWVRFASAIAFFTVACAITAALFTHSAAQRERDPGHRLFLHASTLSLLFAASIVFYAAHRLSVYAMRLLTARASSEVGSTCSQARAWRTGALSALGILVLTLTVTVWACRIHVPPPPERVRKRPKPAPTVKLQPSSDATPHVAAGASCGPLRRLHPL